MDHFFEQKTLRENQELNKQVFKLNKQIKQLQEKVLSYEQLLSELNIMGAAKQGPKRFVQAVIHNITRPSASARVSELGKMETTSRIDAEIDEKAAKSYREADAKGMQRTGRTSGFARNANMADIWAERSRRFEQKHRRNKERVAALIPESHTKAELEKIKNQKGGIVRLRGLVGKYQDKIKNAATAAERKEHRDEIATIRNMLESDSYVPKPTNVKKSIEGAELARKTKFGKYDPKIPENTDKPQQKPTQK